MQWKQIIGKSEDEKAYVTSDELRKDYARVMANTCWTGMVSETDIEKKIKLELLIFRAKDFGFDEDEIRAKLTTMDLVELKKFEESLEKQSQQNGQTEEDCQRIVTEEELEDCLASSWKVQAVLPSGRIVVDNKR